MREFSWRIFAATGNIESYLLYKEHEKIVGMQEEEEEILDDVQDG